MVETLVARRRSTTSRRFEASPLAVAAPGILAREDIPMATTKKPKTEKKPLTTAEFIEQVNKQDVKRNGLKIRFGFTKNQR